MYVNKKYIRSAKGLARDAFEVLLVFYLLMLLLNEFKPTWIAALNLNYILIGVILLGVITILFPAPKKIEIRDSIKGQYIYIIALGIIGTVLIFIKIRELGWLSYVISIIAGILIILLSILVLEED